MSRTLQHNKYQQSDKVMKTLTHQKNWLSTIAHVAKNIITKTEIPTNQPTDKPNKCFNAN